MIAQCLAARAGRGYYDISPGKDGIQGFCLMAKKSGYTHGFQTCLKAGVKGFIQFAENRALMRNAFNVCNLLAVVS
ncbi:MAG: hypothetical protein OEV54_07080 [Dehalococcoidia bacterium]|nr:hypothetical protein [Dehalococcoidia bacterium]